MSYFKVETEPADPYAYIVVQHIKIKKKNIYNKKKHIYIKS